jgi:hypothetical protein
MRELRIAYADVKPRVEFTEADWSKIESAGERRLSDQLRERIRFISFGFVQSHNACPIDAGFIEKRFQSVMEHAEALMRALQINKPLTSVDEWVAMTLNKELMGEEYGQRLPPAWYALQDVVRAAKAGLPKLLSMTVERGLKDPKPIANFIRQMQLVFEDAGGRVTIGTKRIPTDDELGERFETGSVFCDFVHAVHSALARAEENGIRDKDVGSIGSYIKRALRGKKSRP